jgi:hypothetical protein
LSNAAPAIGFAVQRPISKTIYFKICAVKRQAEIEPANTFAPVLHAPLSSAVTAKALKERNEIDIIDKEIILNKLVILNSSS